jgi:hypothetical protein
MHKRSYDEIESLIHTVLETTMIRGRTNGKKKKKKKQKKKKNLQFDNNILHRRAKCSSNHAIRNTHLGKQKMQKTEQNFFVFSFFQRRQRIPSIAHCFDFSTGLGIIDTLAADNE